MIKFYPLRKTSKLSLHFLILSKEQMYQISFLSVNHNCKGFSEWGYSTEIICNFLSFFAQSYNNIHYCNIQQLASQSRVQKEGKV